MRLRWGELPVFLVTVRPTPGSASAVSMACSVKPVRPARCPRAALRNCARLRRRLNAALCGAAVTTASSLGGELLAAEGAAQVKNLAAALGRHAGAKAVTA